MSSVDVLSALYAGRTGLATRSLDEVLPPAFELAGREELAVALGPLPAELPPLSAALGPFEGRMARMAAHLCAPLQGALGAALQRYGAVRVGIVVASSTAGLLATEHAHATRAATGELPPAYRFERTHAFHALVDVLRALTGARGPGYVVSTACSSGNKVFGSAQRLLRSGVVDAVLVGGIDTLCHTTVRGFHSLGILSRSACRPFARDRDGTSIGEGGALLLIERAAEARVALCGVGEGSDAHHMTQPAPDGSGASRAMLAALNDAGLSAGEIDHINAHGTGTPLNDVAESRAIDQVFGRSVPVAATKAATGHVLGAAAALEAVFAIAAIERGQLPPTLHSEPRDPAVALRIETTPIAHRSRHVLSNAFAFGGSNACVIFGASQ